MIEVSAVVLSLDESTLPKALASVRQQKHPITDIILIENISPFHRALNKGAAQVTTPFFIQVDADMIINESCTEILLKHMKKEVGVVVGKLQDPLLGDIFGIKMFRRECFDISQFPNSNSPDTDFSKNIQQQGWQTVYLENLPRSESVLGEHAPIYTDVYTFCKHINSGSRRVYRSDIQGLKYLLRKLRDSEHQQWLLAFLGVIQGVFSPLIEKDVLTKFATPPELEYLQKIQQSTGKFIVHKNQWRPYLKLSPQKVFQQFYELGSLYARESSFYGFYEGIVLLKKDGFRKTWIAFIGIGAGFLSPVNSYTASDCWRILQKIDIEKFIASYRNE